MNFDLFLTTMYMPAVMIFAFKALAYYNMTFSWAS